MRKVTLYWTVVANTALIGWLTVYGSETNALHQMALENAMTLYAWVVLAVVADTAVEAAMTAFFRRDGQGNR